MSETSTPATAPRASTISVSAALRAQRRRVIGWAVAHGHPLHRDALAAIVGAAAAAGLAPGSVWSSTDVGSLMWVGVTEWCQSNGADVPEGDVAASLDTYIRFLSAHHMFAKGSETTATLRRAVGEYGGRPPRTRRHPAMRGHDEQVAPVVPIA